MKQQNIEPNVANLISVSQIGTIVAQMRKEKWYASQNIFSLNPKNKNLFSLYSVAIVDKSLRESFSDGYSNYPTLGTLRNLPIHLPTKNQQPDNVFIDTFISAIQKLVIRDVVLYADRKIAATKMVIGK